MVEIKAIVRHSDCMRTVVTQPAPRHDGPAIPSGDALQNGCLVDSDGQDLAPREHNWLLVDPGSPTCRERKRTQTKRDKTLAYRIFNTICVISIDMVSLVLFRECRKQLKS